MAEVQDVVVRIDVRSKGWPGEVTWCPVCGWQVDCEPGEVLWWKKQQLLDEAVAEHLEEEWPTHREWALAALAAEPGDLDEAKHYAVRLDIKGVLGNNANLAPNPLLPPPREGQRVTLDVTPRQSGKSQALRLAEEYLAETERLRRREY